MDRANQLDNQEWCKTIDPDDMLGLVESLPSQCREAERIARSMPMPHWPLPRHVVVLGMGGSAIGGDLVRALSTSTAGVPIAVNRDYDIPNYIDKESLVVASSYSGNTEETLAGYAQAKKRDAHIIAITTGGELGRLAAADGFPVIRIPGGISPRAALGYSFVPLLVMLERLGILPSQAEALAETVAVLEAEKVRYGRTSALEQNPAKQLAAALVDKVPLILGSQSWKGMAAYRWKCQFNENSKVPAFWNVFPELNHNETVGWEFPPAVTKMFYVVVLRDSADNSRVNRRIEVTKAIMAPRIAGGSEFWAEGKSSVARLLSLIYPGDFASVYLAYLHGADPTPVAVIDHLKKEMALV